MTTVSPRLDPPDGTAALLFDCDGTLVDTMGLYQEIWGDLLAERGFTMTQEWWDEECGYSLERLVLAALPDATETDIQQLRQDSIDLFNERIHAIDPLEHVVDIARRYHGVLPMAVCSASFRETVFAALDAVGITDLFDHVLTADDVRHSKPAPDLYLLGMKSLGVTADTVVVYEDSELGMESARAAGVTRIIDVREFDSRMDE